MPWEIQYDLILPATEAWQAGRIGGIRLSTRPDAINEKNTKELAKLGVRTIELGAQSLADSVLCKAGRGHTEEDIAEAVKTIKESGINCGLQLMIGLPGETWQEIIYSCKQVINLRPDFVRLYPTLVITDTILADLFSQGLYSPLSLKEAVQRTAYYNLQFQQNSINIIRIGLQATEELSDKSIVLAGPYHPAFGEMVEAFIFDTMVTKVMDNIVHRTKNLIIHYHPKEHSKLRGVANSNLRRWKENYEFTDIYLKPDGHNLGEIVIETPYAAYIVNKNMLGE